MNFLILIGAMMAGAYGMTATQDSEEPDTSTDESAEDAGASDAQQDTALNIVPLDQYLNGGRNDDVLDGGIGNDTLFGADGADTLNGGQGDDLLFSGSNELYTNDWNHNPGEISLTDTAGDVLNGGEGDDTLYVGPNSTATGGEGNDTFKAYADNYFGANKAAEITDFTRGEDKLEIDYALHSGVYTTDFSTEDAVNTFMIRYDADADTTTVELDGDDVLKLKGDHSAMTVAIKDAETNKDAPVWLDVEGNEISAAEGARADLILTARTLEALSGEES